MIKSVVAVVRWIGRLAHAGQVRARLSRVIREDLRIWERSPTGKRSGRTS